jgi:hypothetical protein
MTTTTTHRVRAMWLVCQFLDECYPEGGSLFFADAEKWPVKQAECAKALFSAFLERPLYANSPASGVLVGGFGRFPSFWVLDYLGNDKVPARGHHGAEDIEDEYLPVITR